MSHPVYTKCHTAATLDMSLFNVAPRLHRTCLLSHKEFCSGYNLSVSLFAGLNSLSNATLDSALFQTPRWTQLSFKRHVGLSVPPECQSSWNKLFFISASHWEQFFFHSNLDSGRNRPLLLSKFLLGFSLFFVGAAPNWREIFRVQDATRDCQLCLPHIFGVDQTLLILAL